jgi:hypothetical protein
MTPEEIKKHFGEDALDMLYDNIMENAVHNLADWILLLHTEEQIGKWIVGLKAYREETE